MRAPNQYRLVYIRHDYDEVAISEDKVRESGPVRTYTKWMSWDGGKIRTRDSYEIEFRYKADQ